MQSTIHNLNTIIMEVTKEQLETIKSIYNAMPILTFKPERAYQYIDQSKLTPQNKLAIREIEAILEQYTKGRVEFNNFHINKDGTGCLRVQCQWSDDFRGVDYVYINGFLENE